MNLARGKIPSGDKSCRKCIYGIPGQDKAEHSANLWSTSIERRRCSNKAKTRNPLKFAGVPQTGKRISAANQPKFAILWRKYCCLTRFVSDCRYMPSLRRYSPTKLCDGAQMAIFGDFLRLVFSANRVQHVSDLHPKFALATPCAEVW